LFLDRVAYRLVLDLQCKDRLSVDILFSLERGRDQAGREDCFFRFCRRDISSQVHATYFHSSFILASRSSAEVGRARAS